MAVVSRPTGVSRRSVSSGRLRHTLSSWWMTALAYIALLFLGYLLLTPAVIWGQRRLDDVRYGFPRATQLDAFVGHGEEGGVPTHLMALNLRGQVSILELPGGDAGQARSIPGPYLVGADGQYVAPLLSLEDLSGDGQADLLLQVREEIVVYINDAGSFRLVSPAERAALVSAGERGQ